MRRQILAAALVVVAAGPAACAGDAVARTFSAPADRLWTVTLAVLRQLGWDIDKADRDIGWITTDSRKVDGEDYGVYAKGTRHRLRIIVKAQADRSTEGVLTEAIEPAEATRAGSGLPRA